MRRFDLAVLLIGGGMLGAVSINALADRPPCVRLDDSGRCVERLGDVDVPAHDRLALDWQVVGVASTSADHECGVKCFPLDSGEALAFNFDEPHDGWWSMAGVEHPLWLVSIDKSDHAVYMRPGVSGYVLPGATRYVEVRP